MISWRRIALLVAALAYAPLGLGRDIHYGAVTDPAVLECDEMKWRGETNEASTCYANLLQEDIAPAAKAEASANTHAIPHAFARTDPDRAAETCTCTANARA